MTGPRADAHEKELPPNERVAATHVSPPMTEIHDRVRLWGFVPGNTDDKWTPRLAPGFSHIHSE